MLHRPLVLNSHPPPRSLVLMRRAGPASLTDLCSGECCDHTHARAQRWTAAGSTARTSTQDQSRRSLLCVTRAVTASCPLLACAPPHCGCVSDPPTRVASWPAGPHDGGTTWREDDEWQREVLRGKAASSVAWRSRALSEAFSSAAGPAREIEQLKLVARCMVYGSIILRNLYSSRMYAALRK